MARIPRHTIDEVRARTSLEEVVERHVRLQRRGNSLVGLCPFHQEKSPSFHVVPHKSIYHCFGCGAGGDCFRFLMELEGMSFVEAVKELAGAAGVIIEERELSADERQRLRQRASLHDVMEAATAFWQGVLWTRPEGAAARAYLENRDISKETAATWRLGYAPDGWTSTVDHLQQDGFGLRVIAEAGLAKPRRTGQGHYDTFRNRVVIPITDDRGRVIAFGARLMDGEGPKYLNSPETPLYRKSNVLYGLFQARRAIQRADRIIVVEGYFDVISMHQAGFAETVATCGTALTPEHLDKLKRLSRNVLALFDSDTAGARAAERSLPLFLNNEMTSWRIERPGAKDPDEIIREGGAEAMHEVLSKQESLLEWVIEYRMSSGAKKGARTSRESMLDEMVELMALTDDSDIISRVAARLKINEFKVKEAVFRARRQRQQAPANRRDPMKFVPDMQHPSPPERLNEPPSDDPQYIDEPLPGDYNDAPDAEQATEPAPPTAPSWTPTRDMVHVLWLLVHRHTLVAFLPRGIRPAPWSQHAEVTTVIDQLIEGAQVAQLLDEVKDDNIRRTLIAITTRSHLYEDPEAASGMADILHRMVVPTLEIEIGRLSGATKNALRSGDFEAQATAVSSRRVLRKQIKAMKLALRQRNPELWLSLLLPQADGQTARYVE